MVEKIGLEAVLEDQKFNKAVGDYVNNIDKMSGKTRAFAGEAGRGFLDLGGEINDFALNAGLALAGLAIGLATSLGGLAIAAAPLELVRRSFMNTAADGEDMLNRLHAASAGLVTDRKLMEEYNLAVLLVGQAFADDLPRALEILQRVAAATGQPMDYLLNSLITGVGRLSVRLLDNLGITANLTDVYAEWADANDRTVDSMTRSEQQMAVYNFVMDQLALKTATMADMSDTALQSVGNLSVEFRNMAGELGEQLLPSLKLVTDSLGDIAEEYGPQIAEFFVTTLVPAVLILAEAFAQLMSGDLQGAMTTLFGVEQGAAVTEMLIGIKDTLLAIGSWVIENQGLLVQIITAIGVALASAAIANTISNIIAALTALISPVGLVIAAIALLALAWQTNFLGIQDIVASFMEFVQPAIELLSSLWQTHGAAIMMAVDLLSGNIGSASLYWQTVIQGAVNFINEALAMMLKLFQDHLPWIYNLVVLWGQGVTTIYEFVKNTVSAAVRVLVETVLALFRFMGETLLAIITLLWTTITTIWEAAHTAIVLAITNFIETLTTDFTNFKDLLLILVSALWTAAGIIIDTGIAKIIAAWTEWLRVLVARIEEIPWLAKGLKVITDIYDGIVSWFSSFTSDWSAFFRSLLRIVTDIDWKSLGGDLIEGIKAGVMAKAESLARSVAAAAKRALDAAKRALGIGSPSRVAQKMIGVPIAQGIGLGYENELTRFMNTDLPKLTTEFVMAAAAPASMNSMAHYVPGAGLQTVTNNAGASVNYYLTANYKREETEGSLRNTLKLLQVAGGA